MDRAPAPGPLCAHLPGSAMDLESISGRLNDATPRRYVGELMPTHRSLDALNLKHSANAVLEVALTPRIQERSSRRL